MMYHQRIHILFVLFLCSIILQGCGDTQLDRAVEDGRLTKARLILTMNPKLVETTDEDGRTHLHRATVRGQKDAALLLISRGGEVNARDKYGFTPLHFACQRGHLELVRLLIENGADLDAMTHYDHTPLHWAAWRGQKAVVELLVEDGADVFARDKNGETAAQLAYEYGHREVSDLLHPLHVAARNGNLSRMQLLLTEYPDLIEARDWAGRTPLHKAMRYDQSAAVRLLLARGADGNARDSYRYAPHYYSSEMRHERTGIDLLEVSAVEEADYVCYEMLKKYDHVNVGLVVDGQIVFTKAYGDAGLDAEDVYGSVSKPVTAMIIMHLVSEGVIESIDDPIWKYSPRYRNCMPEGFEDDSVTVKHLLIHTSGVPHNDEPTWKGGKLNLKFKPGTRDQYSTPGYGILGHVIEDVTGLSYSDAVKYYIGRPMGAPSYWAEKHFRAPGARVHSTIKDMALFSIGVMNHIYVPEDIFYHKMIQYHNGPAGIGWGILNLNDPELTVFHGGSNGFPQAYLQIKPKKKLSVSILARSKDRSIFELGGLADRLMSVLEESLDEKSPGNNN